MLRRPCRRELGGGDRGGHGKKGRVTPAQAVRALFDVMDHLPVGICVVDADLQVRVFNRMARSCSIFPIRCFEPVLPNFSALLLFNAARRIRPGDPEALAQQRVELARRMEPHHFERKAPDGSVLDIHGEPLPGGGFCHHLDRRHRARGRRGTPRRAQCGTGSTSSCSRPSSDAIREAGVDRSTGGRCRARSTTRSATCISEHRRPGKIHRRPVSMLETYRRPASACRCCAGGGRKTVRCRFLKEDVPTLMAESREGITRVKKIVQDLKDFRTSTTPRSGPGPTRTGIDSTVNRRQRGQVQGRRGQGIRELPDVECLPSQLNQVFMNLLVNAAHAMGEARGRITIRNRLRGARRSGWSSPTNGSGMPGRSRHGYSNPSSPPPGRQGTGLGLCSPMASSRNTTAA